MVTKAEEVEEAVDSTEVVAAVDVAMDAMTIALAVKAEVNISAITITTALRNNTVTMGVVNAVICILIGMTDLALAKTGRSLRTTITGLLHEVAGNPMIVVLLDPTTVNKLIGETRKKLGQVGPIHLLI